MDQSLLWKTISWLQSSSRKDDIGKKGGSMQRVSWDAFLSIFWAIRCMALNLAATVSNRRIGQDSAAWESLGLQGDPTSPFWRRSALFFGRNDAKAETPVLWPPHAKSWLIGKDSDAGRDWGREEKGTTEDEMAGWHHWLDGRESEWTPGIGDGQGGLACCDSWGREESDTTERLNWTEPVMWSLKESISIFSLLVRLQTFQALWEKQSILQEHPSLFYSEESKAKISIQRPHFYLKNAKSFSKNIYIRNLHEDEELENISSEEKTL